MTADLRARIEATLPGVQRRAAGVAFGLGTRGTPGSPPGDAAVLFTDAFHAALTEAVEGIVEGEVRRRLTNRAAVKRYAVTVEVTGRAEVAVDAPSWDGAWRAVHARLGRLRASGELRVLGDGWLAAQAAPLELAGEPGIVDVVNRDDPGDLT